MTREEAIQILSIRDAHGVLCGYTSGVTEALDMAISALQEPLGLCEHCIWNDCNYNKLDFEAPYVQTEPSGLISRADAVQGEWKHTITWQPYCSNCEYVFGEDEEFSPFWKYCPMCGARMNNK